MYYTIDNGGLSSKTLHQFYNILHQTFEFCIKEGMRIHDLRHSCASILINKGAQIADVSALLGHASISTTVDIYGHISMERKRTVVAMMDEVLKVA